MICEALASGEQTLVLRKGGIAEGRRGFSWQHEKFFLFPTHFHQQIDGVRGDREVSPADPDNRIAIELWAEIITTARLTDWDRVTHLATHHVWTEKVVRERFEWGEQAGLSVALLRIHRLGEPWLLADADRPAFGGCRSWLDLPLSEWKGGSGGLAERIASAEAVISDTEFEHRRSEIIPLLEGQASSQP